MVTAGGFATPTQIWAQPVTLLQFALIDLKTGATPKTIPVGKLNNNSMPKYVIEREIAGAGSLTPDQLKGVSQISCGVLNKMGSQIQWVHSYVTADKVYCVYNAPNTDMIREHAEQTGIPANSVSQVATIIDPTTAE